MNGITLKLLRLSRGLKQSELAELLHISQSAVCKMETGYYPITPGLDNKIREVLEVNDRSIRKLERILDKNKRGLSYERK